MQRWHEYAPARRQRLKHVAYMSMEFLIARNLASALAATGLESECRAVFATLGVDLDEIVRHDRTLRSAMVGWRAPGRLLPRSGMGSRGMPATGYGIRFAYGMFKQELRAGWQVELPEDWSRDAKVWEVVREERRYRIRFGGKVHHRGYRAHWVDTEDVIAVAHGLLVAGQGHVTVDTRLWDAEAEQLDPPPSMPGVISTLPPSRSGLDADADPLSRRFHAGRARALSSRSTFVSASLQGHRARPHRRRDLNDMPERVAIHLSDTIRAGAGRATWPGR